MTDLYPGNRNKIS